MDNKDKTPPVTTIEEDLSAEEKAMHEEALKLQEQRAAVASDASLPKVQSDAQQ